jgi:hypothetical protein
MFSNITNAAATEGSDEYHQPTSVDKGKGKARAVEPGEHLTTSTTKLATHD